MKATIMVWKAADPGSAKPDGILTFLSEQAAADWMDSPNAEPFRTVEFETKEQRERIEELRP